MRVIYKGKFKEDLRDYVNSQSYDMTFDNANHKNFLDLPIEMQWGVVIIFQPKIYADQVGDRLSKLGMQHGIKQIQERYNENK